MPITHEIQPANRLLLIACVGTVSFDEILSALRTMRQDPLYRPEFNGVCDVTEGAFGFGPSEARQLAAEIGGTPDRTTGKWAFLLAQPMATALVLVFGTKRGPETPVQVFATATAASAWLETSVSEADLARLRERARHTPPQPFN